MFLKTFFERTPVIVLDNASYCGQPKPQTKKYSNVINSEDIMKGELLILAKQNKSAE